MRLEFDLPCDLDAPAEARQALARVADRVPPAVLGDAKLLVSELVTNALRHAGMSRDETIRIGVEASDHRLFVEVSDRGPGFGGVARARKPPSGAASGYGLYLVETLADRWGVNGDGENRVWFELAT